MKAKKIVVWDLFGGGQNSVFNALKNNNKFDIYTFDVTQPTRKKHFKFDLAQDNICEKMKDFQKQNNIPNPDIIVSSTLCQSFSSVLSMKGGGTPFWKYNKDSTKLVEREVEEFEKLKSGFTRFLKADVQLFIKRLGEKCINNTIALIDCYNPNFWYIENPKSSLIWKYITLNLKDWFEKSDKHLNTASYGKYGFLIRKDTIFLSNQKMDLLSGKVPAPYHLELEECSKNEYLKNKKTRSKMFCLKDGKYYKKWYVQNGHTLSDGKQYATLFPKDAGLGKLQKIAPKSQKTKLSNEQICEAGSVSHIPPKLVQAIFKYFERSTK